MRLPVFRNPGDCREELDRMDPRLAEVIRQTSHHRWFQNTLREELHRADHPVVPPPLPPAEPSKMTKSAKRRINKKTRDAREQVPKRAGSHQRGLQVKKEVLGNTKAKQVKLAQDGDSKPCPKCSYLPLEERCIRVVRVKFRKCAHLIGGALTSALPGNRLQPKPPVRGLPSYICIC